LAQCRLHAGHVPLADLLRDEVPAGPQVRGDRAQVEWRVPVDDHVKSLGHRLKPVAADPEAQIGRRRVLSRERHHRGVRVDSQPMGECSC
jgi:hypothetical protein